MSTIIGQIPLVAGVLLIMSGAVLVWKRPSEGNPLTVMFLAGVALLLLSDQGILNLKFGASGVEVTRRDLHDAQASTAVAIARIQQDLETQKAIVAKQTRLLQDYQTTLETLGPRDGEARSRAILDAITTESQKPNANAAFVVLVFFRDGQKAGADAITAALLKAGYQSAATNTDLTELVDDIAGDRHTNAIVISAKDNTLSILPDVKRIVDETAGRAGLEASRRYLVDRNFRRGNVQVYIF